MDLMTLWVTLCSGVLLLVTGYAAAALWAPLSHTSQQWLREEREEGGPL